MPKQYQLLDGKPVLYHTLAKFESCPIIENILIVVAQEWMPYVSQGVVDRFDFDKVRKITAGGKTRQKSVYLGLKALDEPPEIVVIHDAVRPFVSVEKISETVHACREYGAAIIAVRPKDTIKTERDGFVENTLSRERLWAVQTPQAFRYDLILEAHRKALEMGIQKTDDAALAEAMGHRVKIVEGEHTNIKITVPLDLRFAELIIMKEL